MDVLGELGHDVVRRRLVAELYRRQDLLGRPWRLYPDDTLVNLLQEILKFKIFSTFFFPPKGYNKCGIVFALQIIKVSQCHFVKKLLHTQWKAGH